MIKNLLLGACYLSWGLFSVNQPLYLPDFDESYNTSLDELQEKTRYF
jgi:hypothetical protein